MIKYQNGILVDTSVWIDFFNNKYSVHANLLESFIKNNEKIFICPVNISRNTSRHKRRQKI